METKDRINIESIVKHVFRHNLEELKCVDDKLIIKVNGKAYGDGYSSYVHAKYKDGIRIETSFDGRYDKSSIDMLENKLGILNLKKLNVIRLSECYD